MVDRDAGFSQWLTEFVTEHGLGDELRQWIANGPTSK